jgi:hypothetical protein
VAPATGVTRAGRPPPPSQPARRLRLVSLVAAGPSAACCSGQTLVVSRCLGADPLKRRPFFGAAGACCSAHVVSNPPALTASRGAPAAGAPSTPVRLVRAAAHPGRGGTCTLFLRLSCLRSRLPLTLTPALDLARAQPAHTVEWETHVTRNLPPPHSNRITQLWSVVDDTSSPANPETSTVQQNDC